MKKLGGRLNIADRTRPSHTDASATPEPSRATAVGRAVTSNAVAQGVTTRAKSNSVPTTCTAIVTTSASSRRNTTPSAFTGTPFASATCGSTDAKVSGRAITTRTRATPAVTNAKTVSWAVVTARRFPNSTFVTARVFCVASELKSRPRPVANARIVPVAISRSSISLPSSPIASAPATQKAPRPSVIGMPMSAANVAPGNAMWASACAANACRRTTTKYPSIPAASATSDPPMNAWRMKEVWRMSTQSDW